ncbi:hypothetical protein [Actinoplanes sp. G11-F43]|uniref:hypothetical protein n=1 Tax=Actinoplanes sp. G11-F43 TaxID=3424130 RepID=UPI003D3478CA
MKADYAREPVSPGERFAPRPVAGGRHVDGIDGVDGERVDRAGHVDAGHLGGDLTSIPEHECR